MTHMKAKAALLPNSANPALAAPDGLAPATLQQLVHWRRDVRRFRSDAVSTELLMEILRLADQSPSVGNSQPWRVVNVACPAMRALVRKSFEVENRRAAQDYAGQQADHYRNLKLAGFDKAPVHLAIYSDHDSLQGHRLGQKTMPETLDQSVVCMITLLWLAAREKGLGLGWVSIIDPAAVSAALAAPSHWRLVGYLLLGWPEEEHLDPDLERAGWQSRTPFENRFFEIGPGAMGLGGQQHVSSDRASAAVERTRAAVSVPGGGRVMLVGAGPGDPQLLTRRALAALSCADVVLHDDLVSDAIIALVRPGAEIIHVGKRGYRPSCKQPDINAMMVEHARRGRLVVRLKSGDPLIFGRAGEELAACKLACIPIEVVPGITSAQGAAARLGVSLTHRDHARRLQFITAHDRHGHLPPDIDWSAVADPAATTVVYMPKRTLPELAAQALASGLPASTPAIAVANATRPNQWVLTSTVDKIAEQLAQAEVQGPVLVMIGEALRDAAAVAELAALAGVSG